MSKGTIDLQGFRRDLASIAASNYPKLGLIKLPFNWFAPQTSGIQSTTMGLVGSGGAVITVPAGDAIIVFGYTSNTGGSPPTIAVTDSQGNTYTHLGQAFGAFFGYTGDAFICPSAIGGSATISLALTAGTGILRCVTVLVVGGVTGVTDTGFGTGTAATSGTSNAGDYVLSAASAPQTTPTTWTENSGYTLLLDNVPSSPAVSQYMSYKIATAGGVQTNTIAAVGFPGNPIPNMIVTVAIGAGGTPPAPTITSITLPGPCNFLALVSEAIDEQGLYQSSALLGQQAAAGFIRLNGQGNVWIPISFANPLTPGYVTTNDNYTNTPIAGTGFQALEAPFGILDWRPAQPVFYTGPTPPTTPAGYLLAFAGINVGVDANVGNGRGSTLAIPSAAGPIERLKCAGVKL